MATGATLQIPGRRAAGGLTAGKVWRAFRRYPIIPVFVLVFVLILPAVLAEIKIGDRVLFSIAPYDPLEGQLSARLTPPFWIQGGTPDHWIGTDKQGRDILTRIIFGARISLMVSLSAICIGGSIGTTLGLSAAYFGGWVEGLIMRIVDTFLSMPLILLALVVVAVFGPSFFTVIGIVSSLIWVGYTRQTRGEALTIRQLDFVARARVAGASPVHIMFRHFLPNVINTIIVLATLEMGSVILLESTLSFLGAGIPRPFPSWGVMVADGRDHIIAAWWIAFFPGIAIMLVVLSANLMGDWLRDQLDPKLRQV